MDLLALAGRARMRASQVAGVAKALKRTLDHSAFPIEDGTLEVRGVDARVEVVRDRWGVPYVLASTAPDAFFGHGFVHAQDRLFQMEGARRTAAGRLSEIAGQATLGSDRLMRRIGLNRAARRDAECIGGEVRDLLDAYARGVNEGVRHLPALPPEFALFGDAWEPWSIEDTMLVGRLVMFGFAGNWNTELVRERLARELGPDVAAAVDPVHPPSATVTGNPYPRAADALLEVYRATVGRGLGGLSSNAWAVSGSRSTTGAPLLASDPHVDVALPGLFHVAHIRGGPVDVVGAGIPGIPSIAIGHNATVAWGITAGMADVADCYVEEFASTQSLRYRTLEGWSEAEEIAERIDVLGTAAVDERVLVTRHGPVISPALRGETRAIALHSSVVADAPGGDIAAPFIAVARATTFEEVNRAVEGWPSTTFNFVLASTDGHIGYRFVGQVPAREAHAGLFPQDGATSSGPPGFVPVEELPRLIDPEDGVVASANNAPGGPHELGEEWSEPRRWERIVELLAEREQHDPSSFCAIQLDRRSANLERLRDLLIARGAAVPEVRVLLETWDGRLQAADAAAAVVMLTYRELAIEAAERVGGRLGLTIIGAVDDGLTLNSAFAYRAQHMLVRAAEEASHPWFEGEADRDRRLRGAVHRAVRELDRICGDPVHWSLGAVQQIPYRHALAGVPGIGARWSRGEHPFGGDVNTVVQAQGSATGIPDLVRIAPGYRQVLNLADWDTCVFMHPTGNSGIPDHPRYDDCIEEYLAGLYRPLLFNERAIRAASVSSLILLPAELRGDHDDERGAAP